MSVGLAEVMSLLRRRGALSQAEIAEATGLSRSAIVQRMGILAQLDLVRPSDSLAATGGRPTRRFTVALEGAIILAADIGASGFQAAACDLRGKTLRAIRTAIDVSEGPERVLALVRDAFRDLEAEGEVWGVGVDVPGPVDPRSGKVLHPSTMVGWHGFGVRKAFRSAYAVPTVVEKDANVKALAEARARNDLKGTVLGIKFGTAVGAGIVDRGRILRGRNGAAGDIGHSKAILPSEVEPRLCVCGMSGCVDAHCSGLAMTKELQAQGVPIATTADIVEAVRHGNPTARRILRESAEILGHSVATLVSVVNPTTIVIGGQFAECGSVVSDAIEEQIYRNTLPLVSRGIKVEMSSNDPFSGVEGLADVTADAIFSPANLKEMLRRARG